MEIVTKDIIQKYEDYQKFIKESTANINDIYHKKYAKYIHDPNAVIDENMSVKWNRDEVQRLKAEYKALMDEHNNLRITKLEDIKNMIKDYVQQEYPNITNKKFSAMTNFLLSWDEDAYYMYNGAGYTIDCLMELAELICS